MNTQGTDVVLSGIHTECGYWNNDKWVKGTGQENPCNLFKNTDIAEPLTTSHNTPGSSTAEKAGFTNRIFNTRIIEGMTQKAAPDENSICEKKIYTYINPSCKKTKQEIKNVEQVKHQKKTEKIVKQNTICQEKQAKQSERQSKIARMQKEINDILVERNKCLGKKACKKNEGCPTCPVCPAIEERNDQYIIHNNQTAPQKDKFGNVRVICRNNNADEDNDFIPFGPGIDGVDGAAGVDGVGIDGAAGAAAESARIQKNILKAHIGGGGSTCFP